MQHLISVLIAICVGFTLADPNDRDAVVKEHNRLRSIHGSPALTLDVARTKSAQNWAETMASTGKFKHQDPLFPSSSESIYYSSDLAMKDNEAYLAATKKWYDEVLKYKYSAPDYSVCGHFMNMVWKGAKSFGIGVARNTTTSRVYVCAVYHYSGGTNADNVLPPKKCR